MKKAVKLYLLKISQRPQQKISINIIGLSPRSNNKEEKIAKIYKWKIHRIPKKILSNRGPQFILWFMKDLSKISETKRTLSTVYYFQTNSQTERID